MHLKSLAAGAAALVVCLMGCGQGGDDVGMMGEIASASRGITNGTVTTSYPEVGAITGPELGLTQCTATVIGPTTLLTAAHCLHADVSDQRFLASDGSVYRLNTPAIRAGFVSGVPDYDIATVKLDRPASVPAATYAQVSPSQSQILSLVGLGNYAPGQNDGQKRVTFNWIDHLYSRYYDFTTGGNSGSAEGGLLPGDSGGPTFQTLNGAVLVVGIHHSLNCSDSSTQLRCEQTATGLYRDTRVGTHCDFISLSLTQGSIEDKHRALGLCGGILGGATSEEKDAPNGGKYVEFRNGRIWASFSTGTFETHGEIGARYNQLYGPWSSYGYPTTDELAGANGGRFQHFQGGSIFWKANTGAKLVYGAIRDEYGRQGWESGWLGYPSSDEYSVSDGRREDFEGGYIIASMSSGVRVYRAGTSVPIPPPPQGCGALQPGQGLSQGQSVTSCDGRFVLVLQGDGNLVLYQNGVGALWASGTNGQDGYVLNMQGDGNLVLYTRYGTPIWHAGTFGNPGAWLAVQTDGNAVIYGGSALWATGTGGR